MIQLVILFFGKKAVQKNVGEMESWGLFHNNLSMFVLHSINGLYIVKALLYS